MIEDADDLGAMLDPDEFATRAYWRAAGTGRPRELAGIFVNGYAAPILGGGLAAEEREITFACAAAQLPEAAQGDSLEVGGIVYRVRSARPDGAGLVRLVLGS